MALDLNFPAAIAHHPSVMDVVDSVAASAVVSAPWWIDLFNQDAKVLIVVVGLVAALARLVDIYYEVKLKRVELKRLEKDDL